MVAEVVERTLNSMPKDVTHWSVRRHGREDGRVARDRAPDLVGVQPLASAADLGELPAQAFREVAAAWQKISATRTDRLHTGKFEARGRGSPRS